MNDGSDDAGGTETPAWFASNGWQKYEADGFIEHVGPFFINVVDEQTRIGFLAKEHHRNRRGLVQGGMIATLADRAMGHASRAANGERAQATVQLDLHYVEKACIGEFVEARCRVIRVTRQLAFVTSDIFANDRLVATAHGVWKILSGTRGNAPGCADRGS